MSMSTEATLASLAKQEGYTGVSCIQARNVSMPMASFETYVIGVDYARRSEHIFRRRLGRLVFAIQTARMSRLLPEWPFTASTFMLDGFRALIIVAYVPGATASQPQVTQGDPPKAGGVLRDVIVAITVAPVRPRYPLLKDAHTIQERMEHINACVTKFMGTPQAQVKLHHQDEVIEEVRYDLSEPDDHELEVVMHSRKHDCYMRYFIDFDDHWHPTQITPSAMNECHACDWEAMHNNG